MLHSFALSLSYFFSIANFMFVKQCTYNFAWKFLFASYAMKKNWKKPLPGSFCGVCYVMGYDIERQGHNRFLWFCNILVCSLILKVSYLNSSNPHSLPMVNPKQPLHCRGMGSRSQQAQITWENTCLLLNFFINQNLVNIYRFLLEKNPNNHIFLRVSGQR